MASARADAYDLNRRVQLPQLLGDPVSDLGPHALHVFPNALELCLACVAELQECGVELLGLVEALRIARVEATTINLDGRKLPTGKPADPKDQLREMLLGQGPNHVCPLVRLLSCSLDVALQLAISEPRSHHGVGQSRSI